MLLFFKDKEILLDAYYDFIMKLSEFSKLSEDYKAVIRTKLGLVMVIWQVWCKVHIFWEGNKILRNLHHLFVLCTASLIIGGDFAKFCGLLRIYELYLLFRAEYGENRSRIHKSNAVTRTAPKIPSQTSSFKTCKNLKSDCSLNFFRTMIEIPAWSK